MFPNELKVLIQVKILPESKKTRINIATKLIPLQINDGIKYAPNNFKKSSLNLVKIVFRENELPKDVVCDILHTAKDVKQLRTIAIINKHTFKILFNIVKFDENIPLIIELNKRNVNPQAIKVTHSKNPSFMFAELIMSVLLKHLDLLSLILFAHLSA